MKTSEQYTLLRSKSNTQIIGLGGQVHKENQINQKKVQQVKLTKENISEKSVSTKDDEKLISTKDSNYKDLQTKKIANKIIYLGKGKEGLINIKEKENISKNVINKKAPKKNVFKKNTNDFENEHKNNPQFMTEYINEIYETLMKEEKINKPKYDNTMCGISCKITERQRRSLINWLINLHNNLELEEETLYLAMNMLDRLISANKVTSNQFLLYGFTCLITASKYHEIYPPELNEFLYESGKNFDDSEIFKAEIDILKNLNYELHTASLLTYLEYFYNVVLNLKEPSLLHMSMMLANFCFMSPKLLNNRPSVLSTALLSISANILDKKIDLESMYMYSITNENEIKKIKNDFATFYNKVIKKTKYTAIINKFSKDQFDGIGGLFLNAKI